MLFNLLSLIVILILLTAVYASLSAAPWLPTRKKETERMINLANLKSGDVVYDLGCGDGRLLLAARKKVPGIKIVGAEISFLLYLIARLRIKNILFKNLFKVDLSKADVVFIYLLPKCYEQLKAKLSAELKPGSRVVVGVWPIQGWENKLIKKDKPTEFEKLFQAQYNYSSRCG
jgi:SAM-dependent methyltransferase